AGAGGYGHGAGGDWLYQLVFTLFVRGLACAALGLAAVCSLLASGGEVCAWLSSGAEICRSLMTVLTPATRPASSAAAMRSWSVLTCPVSVTAPSLDTTAICLLSTLGSAKNRLCTSVTMRASSGGEDFEQPNINSKTATTNGITARRLPMLTPLQPSCLRTGRRFFLAENFWRDSFVSFSEDASTGCQCAREMPRHTFYKRQGLGTTFGVRRRVAQSIPDSEAGALILR